MNDAVDAPIIVATLKHGKVLERKYRIFFWCCLIFILTCSVIAIIAMLVDFLIDTTENRIPASEFAAFTAVLLVLTALTDGLFGYLLTRDRKYRREVEEWLNDAIKLKAYCEECDNQIFMPLVHNVTCVGNVKVTFNFKGNKKTLRSNFSNRRNGTGTVFTRFVNKEIYIMYSPKYKQVMFIDEQCEQSESPEIL